MSTLFLKKIKKIKNRVFLLYFRNNPNITSGKNTQATINTTATIPHMASIFTPAFDSGLFDILSPFLFILLLLFLLLIYL